MKYLSEPEIMAIHKILAYTDDFGVAREDTLTAIVSLVESLIEPHRAKAWDEGVNWSLQQRWRFQYDEKGNVTKASTYMYYSTPNFNPYRKPR